MTTVNDPFHDLGCSPKTPPPAAKLDLGLVQSFMRDAEEAYQQNMNKPRVLVVPKGVTQLSGYETAVQQFSAANHCVVVEAGAGASLSGPSNPFGGPKAKKAGSKASAEARLVASPRSVLRLGLPEEVTAVLYREAKRRSRALQVRGAKATLPPPTPSPAGSRKNDPGKAPTLRTAVAGTENYLPVTSDEKLDKPLKVRPHADVLIYGGPKPAAPKQARMEAYTDGSCLKNPGGPTGWAAVIVSEGVVLAEFHAGQEGGTNNTAELMGVITALENTDPTVPMAVYSDSEYVVKGLNEWMKGWLKKKPFPFYGVKNMELWKRLHALRQNRDVTFHWVRGHNGHEFNERADKLAGKAAWRYKTA